LLQKRKVLLLFHNNANCQAVVSSSNSLVLQQPVICSARFTTLVFLLIKAFDCEGIFLDRGSK
jgi:hypothetical protein